MVSLAILSKVAILKFSQGLMKITDFGSAGATSSRREGDISMEELDSQLFRIPGLADDRASFDGRLIIEARTRCEGLEKQIFHGAETVCPDLQMVVHTAPSGYSDRPMYLGKRHIVKL